MNAFNYNAIQVQSDAARPLSVSQHSLAPITIAVAILLHLVVAGWFVATTVTMPIDYVRTGLNHYMHEAQ